MRLVWQVVKLTFLDFIEEIFLLILFNIFWCVSALLVVPLPFATVGLAWVAAEISEGRAIKLKTFFDGGQRYWKPAYLWGLINLVVWGIMFANVVFYSELSATWTLLVRSLILSVAILWGAMQLYVFPLLIRQEAPSLKLAYRNGLVLIGTRPVLTIVVVVLTLVSLLLSLMLTLPLVVLYFAFIAVLSNRAVAEALKAEEARQGY